MAGPTAEFTTACRTEGALQRHIFFKLVRTPDPNVLAWDGVGDFTFNGDTYLGVRGLGQIQGISDSADIQNHEIVATLNGVATSSLASLNATIRDQAATITAVWIVTETGAYGAAGDVYKSKVIFSGKGNVLQLKLNETEKTVNAKLRAPLAEWRTPPKAFWTDKDQQRRYPGDTGMKFVKQLENISVSGWSKDPESTGATPIWLEGCDFRDNVNLTVLGDHTRGVGGRLNAGSAIGNGPIRSPSNADLWLVRDNLTEELYKEQDSEAVLEVDTATYFIKCGSVNCYIDVFGDVRTAGGKLCVSVQDDSTTRIRVQTAIAAIGTATAVSIQQAGGSSGGIITTSAGAVVYCNRFGLRAIAINPAGTVLPKDRVDGTVYVEETTGNAVTFVAGVMKCNGNTVFLSSTGVARTSSALRVIRTGGDATKDFLRVWL